MNRVKTKNVLLIFLFSSIVSAAAGQTNLPEELTTETIKGQLEYVEKKTRIYENFRAVREDIFQKVNRNVLDTLSAEKKRIIELRSVRDALISSNDSLNVLLENTRAELGEVTATKNRIRVLGLDVGKNAYNSFMWTLMGIIVFLALIGFLIFKRNLVVLLRTEKDLKELKEEFEAYRQSSRLAREKVEMDLFRANQKLKNLSGTK